MKNSSDTPCAPPRASARKTGPSRFPILESFAERLERLRHERGLSMRALAAQAKISTNHYQSIAHARSNPSVIVLLSLAEALGVSVADLFEWPRLTPDTHRAVFSADLKELAAAHGRLSAVVERIAKHAM